ncbi:hypothetical protein [Methylobacterium sp. CM6257]
MSGGLGVIGVGSIFIYFRKPYAKTKIPFACAKGLKVFALAPGPTEAAFNINRFHAVWQVTL